MKFLMFNLVVAAALVFLFAGDKGDLAAIAGKAERAVEQIKTKAVEVIKPAEEVSQKPVSAPAAAPVPAIEKKAPPAPKPPPVAKAETAPPVPEKTVAARTPQPPLPPEVKKRRAEVLNDAGAPAPKAGKFMSSGDRKRELLMLSEEMELFSAKAIAR